MIKKISYHLFSIAMFLFFVIATIVLTNSYIDDYQLLSIKKTEGVIVEKEAVKGLYLKPSYFVHVETQTGRENSSLSRISFKQIEELGIGDKIEGYAMSGNGFSTIRDILFDSVLYIIGILTFGFLACVLAITILCEIPAVDRFLNKTFLGRSTGGSSWKVILAFIVVISVYFSYLFLFNLFNATIPVFQTKTDAVIIEKDSYITYRKYEDSSYDLTLEYRNSNGEFLTTIKEVTRHTYNKYSNGDLISIRYRDNNPHDIFISKTSFFDIFQAMLYMEILLFVFCIIIISMMVIYFYNKWRKGKAGRK